MNRSPVDTAAAGSPATATGAATAPVVLVFSLWTLFVWGGRLRNLFLADGGLAEAGRWSLAGAVGFTVLGLVVAGVWFALRFGSSVGERGAGSGPSVAVSALAVLTTVVWLVRGVDIAVGDHSVGFIVVHLMLAVVSIGLAALSVLTLRRVGTAPLR